MPGSDARGREFSPVERVGGRNDRHEVARIDGGWLSEFFDNGRRGVIQLDRDARIVTANDQARGLLGREDGLFEEDEFLNATAPEDNRKLQRLIALAMPSPGSRGSSGSMTIGREAAVTRLVIHTFPVPARQSGFGPRQVAVLVLVTDPESRPRVDVDLVQAVFDLTPTESLLATMVAAGLRPSEIAARTGRREGTVRWHISQIFRKQGISSQVDLTRRILSLEGFPRYRPRT